MSQRYDVCTPRPKQGGGSWWHRVGSAFKNDEGLVTIYLDSVPMPDPAKDNKVVMMLFEPRDKEAPASTGKGKGKPSGKQRPLAEELDDEIPF